MALLTVRVNGPALLGAKTSTYWRLVGRLLSPFRVVSNRQGFPGPFVAVSSRADVAATVTDHHGTRFGL